MNYDKTCQLLIIGDSSVGKTSLITRYTNGTFKEEYLATVGLDYYSKEEVINNKTINIKLWDTAGQERYKSLTQNYFKNAEGVLLTYDITNSESFDNLKEWISSIKKNMEGKDIFIPVIIIGNKIDMEDSRETSKEDAEKFAKENNYKYFETSAKTGEGVDDAIRELVIQILKQNGQIDDQKEARASSVQIKEENLDKKSEKKKGCC
jgi:small GTP-binding protein